MKPYLVFHYASHNLDLGHRLAFAEGALADVARQLGATATQVALSWLLQRAPNILPIPGTTSIVHLEENVEARKIDFTPDQLQQLERFDEPA